MWYLFPIGMLIEAFVEWYYTPEPQQPCPPLYC
jgi:hypothetical protein